MFDGIELSNAYPNPANTSATITSIIPPQFNDGLLYLFDMHGRQLRSYPLIRGVNQTAIDVSKLASGEYFLVLSLEGWNVKSTKLQVVK